MFRLAGPFLDYMLSRFGFNDKWRGLIHARGFFGNLAVFANDCSTQEISI